MLSIFVAQTLCSEYCNETTILPDGFVCCSYETCSGYCYYRDETHQYCISEMDKFICVDMNKGPFVVIGSFFVPTLIMMVASCIKRAKVPAKTFIVDLILNLFLGMFVYGTICFVKFSENASLFFSVGCSCLFTIGIFRITNLCFNCDCGTGKDMTAEDFARKQNAFDVASTENCCECCRVKKSDDYNKCICNIECLEVLKDLRSPKVTKEELETIIEENHLIPPTPQIEIIDFDKGDKGQPIIRQTRYSPVQYGSWEEETAPPQIGNASLIAYRCHSKYIYDNDMKAEIEKAEAQAKEFNPKTASFQALVTISETAGTTHRAIGVAEDTCVVCCCTSCFVTHFLYQLLSFFGYSSIIDTIWFSSVQKIEETSIKKIALDEKTYRARCGERDRRLVEYARTGESLNTSIIV